MWYGESAERASLFQVASSSLILSHLVAALLSGDELASLQQTSEPARDKEGAISIGLIVVFNSYLAVNSWRLSWFHCKNELAHLLARQAFVIKVATWRARGQVVARA